MATTKSLQLPGLDVASGNPECLPYNVLINFVLIDSSRDEVSSTATYAYSGGAAADAVTVTVKRTLIAKTGMVNNSVRLSALVKTTITETGFVGYEPIEAVIAWNHKGEYLPSADDALTMVSAAYGIVARMSDNEGPSNIVFNQLDHGVLSNIFTGLDDGV